MVVQLRDWKAILKDRRHARRPSAPVEIKPRCRWCRKPLPKRATTVRVPAGEYRHIDDVRPLFSEQVISTVRDIDNEFIQAVGLWDGKSFQGYPKRLPHFCTTTCAVEFALDACQHGHKRR